MLGISSLNHFRQHLSHNSIHQFTPTSLLTCFEALQSTCEDPQQVHEIYRELACIPVDAEHQNAFHERIQALAKSILDFALTGCDGKSVRTNFQFIKTVSKTVSNLVEDIEPKERSLPMPALSSSSLKFIVDYLRGSSFELKEIENQFYGFQYLNIDLCKYFLPRTSLVIGPEKWREWGLMEVSESDAEAFAQLGPDAILNPVKTAQSHVICRIPPKVSIQSLLKMFCKRFPDFKVLHDGLGFHIRHLEKESDGEWLILSKRSIALSNVKGYKRRVAAIQVLRDGNEQADVPSSKQLIFALIGHFLNTGTYLLEDRMCMVKGYFGLCIGRFSPSGLVISRSSPGKVGVAIRAI